jgi:hypothetical protein
MRAVIFAINFGAATLLLGGCIVCLIIPYYEGGSFATLGGLVLLAPAAIFARSEWLAFYRRELARERRLGWACLGLAGLLAFGLVLNVAQGVTSTWPSGFGRFVAGALAITAYLAGCGISRVSRRPDRPAKKPSSTAFAP